MQLNFDNFVASLESMVDVHTLNAQLRDISKMRWFSDEEALFILTNPNKFPNIPRFTSPPAKPPNGFLYYYIRDEKDNFSNDGVVWEKKGDSGRVREDFVNKWGILSCFKAVSVDHTIRRFRYSIRKGVAKNSNYYMIYLIHYRYSDQSCGDFTGNIFSSTPIQSNGVVDDDSLNDYEYQCLQSLCSEATSNPISYADLTSAKTPPLSSMSLILDFAPERSEYTGGTKVLVCVEHAVTDGWNYYISFGGSLVPAVIVSPTVLRCISPCKEPGACVLEVFVGNYANAAESLMRVSQPSASEFVFVSNIANIDKNQSDNSLKISPFVDSFMKNFGSPLDVHSNRGEKRVIRLNSETSDDQMEEEEYDFLDDSALHALSTHDLEKLSDRFAIDILNQLVAVATVDDDLLVELNTADQYGYTMLHYCALYNFLSLIRTLIAKGADISARADSGATPLHLAASAGRTDAVRILLESGADWKVKDDKGYNVLDSAIRNNREDIRVLIEEFKKSTGDLGTEFSHSSLSDRGIAGTHSRESSYSSYQMVSNSISPSADVHDAMSSAMEFAENGKSSEDHASANLSENTPNNVLLWSAFASLSLADKCALSISFGPSSTSESVSVVATPTVTDEADLGFSKEFQDISNLDMNRVMSVSDKEKLGLVMSLMAPNELKMVEDEVRLIQNNVRGWLLRKNYVSMRDAALTLQNAWREKRRVVPSSRIQHPASRSIGPYSVAKGLLQIQHKVAKRRKIIHDTPRSLKRKSSGDSEYSEYPYRSHSNADGVVSSAALTLQARTRGMLARSILRKQSAASTVIQRWWESQHKEGSI